MSNHAIQKQLVEAEHRCRNGWYWGCSASQGSTLVKHEAASAGEFSRLFNVTTWITKHQQHQARGRTLAEDSSLRSLRGQVFGGHSLGPVVQGVRPLLRKLQAGSRLNQRDCKLGELHNLRHASVKATWPEGIRIPLLL